MRSAVGLHVASKSWLSRVYAISDMETNASTLWAVSIMISCSPQKTGSFTYANGLGVSPPPAATATLFWIGVGKWTDG